MRSVPLFASSFLGLFSNEKAHKRLASQIQSERRLGKVFRIQSASRSESARKAPPLKLVSPRPFFT